jgi:hypothetical protein
MHGKKINADITAFPIEKVIVLFKSQKCLISKLNFYHPGLGRGMLLH